jgi:Tol biopolymer transport system component
MLVPATISEAMRSPAFSPDGHRIAYVSCDGVCGIYVVALERDLSPSSPPRRLPIVSASYIGNVAWGRDGHSLIYDGSPGFLPDYLWRIPSDGTGMPEKIQVAGSRAFCPAVSRTSDRLVFTRSAFDTDIYQFDVGHNSPRTLLTSPYEDYDPAFSPDGRDIAFVSGRLAEGAQIWRARADGSDAHPLAFGPGQVQDSPHWSPDGSRIAFDSSDEDGHRHIWTIDATGGAGTLHRVTKGPGKETNPTWSGNGEDLYYSATTEGQQDIWRISVATGIAARVTHTGSGRMAYEWNQGHDLVYQEKDGLAPLLLLTLETGTIRRLADCATSNGFGVAERGISYVSCQNYELHFIDAKTTVDRELAALPPDLVPMWPIAFSPTGTTVLYPKPVNGWADLMVIENFR